MRQHLILKPKLKFPKKLILLLSTFFIVSSIGLCQNKFEKDFSTDVIDKTWSVEDASQKTDYESMYVFISKDSLTMVYVNWIEGMSMNQCSFTKKDLKFCFELSMKNCIELPETKFVYGYLTEDKKKLNLLLSENRLISTESIKARKDWIILNLKE
jgi:hypothetical protein